MICNLTPAQRLERRWWAMKRRQQRYDIQFAIECSTGLWKLRYRWIRAWEMAWRDR